MVQRRERMELHLLNRLNDSKNIFLINTAILKEKVDEDLLTMLKVPTRKSSIIS